MKITDLSDLCKWETLNNRQCIKYLFAPLYMCVLCVCVSIYTVLSVNEYTPFEK